MTPSGPLEEFMPAERAYSEAGDQSAMSVTKKQKLELTWIGKDVRPRLEPRILLQDTEKS